MKAIMHLKANVFDFSSYSFEPDKKRILFNYKTEFENKETIFFTETVILPEIPDINSIPEKLIQKLLENLHIMLGISYYKFYCAKRINLNYNLSKKEADFWNIVYRKGLGEFFYKNSLDPANSPKFPYNKNSNSVSYNLEKSNKCLVGIGGGKDSIVSVELLKNLSGGNSFNATAFVVQTNKSHKLVDKIIGLLNINSLRIKRILDPKVFEQHQYNGHIPISAIYAFLGVFSAVLYKYSYVIVGNEYSSNFGNLKYRGEIVNHQWSKSYEFEKLFQNYLKDFITTDVLYFSLLRPFYEIRIVKMFSQLGKEYLPYFSSCNANFKIRKENYSLIRTNKRIVKWCGRCPKCVFVFTLLSVYLSKKELLDMFGKNLYEDKTLLPLFKDVLGFGKTKPFDCVGTFEEAQTALFLAKNSAVLSEAEGPIRQIAKRVKYHKEVFKVNKDNSIPEQFKLLGMESVLIIGYGKEGKITEKYIKRYYPEFDVGIADEKRGENYLEKQKNFDIAVKTPGIKKELIKIPYTTATNIFFSKVSGHNKIIGVTGSKGKSTTSSLIFEILKLAGKNVKLLGNIGKPMLEILLNPIKKNQIFVLELSSYQLDDIKFSPDIAVTTNLFPEHMDYHNGLANYYTAKKNIINFQGRGSYFVYNAKNRIITGWLKNYAGKAIPFPKNIPLKDSEIPIIGEHNKDNIRAAIAVARILNIPEKIIKEAIKNFKGLPHRLEFIGQFKGIKFYDDAISTTPESTIMAIKSLKNIDTIFLGGEDRGYDFSQLEKTIRKYKIKNIVLFPESGDGILKQVSGFHILRTQNMKKAVQFAYKNTKKDNICLLSCASPSYSLWKSFEEKGNEFKKFIKRLSK